MNKVITYNKEIESIYKMHCEENKINFSKQDFIDFLKFLEIDLYDWVKENIKSFSLIKRQ